jgi:hypothetical protein
MCLQENSLLDSHFVSDAIYKLVGTQEFEPVRVTEKGIFPTRKQVHHHLLCADCEQRLTTEGENWTIPLLSRVRGPFLLRDRLLSQPPVFQNEVGAIFAGADNPEIEVPKLIHFALGTFFKGAVHSWKRNESEPWIKLEPDDVEALRLYLQGEAQLPPHIALEVTVDSSLIVWPAIRMLWRGSDGRFPNYCLYVPGVLFNLYIGPGAQETLKAGCINAIQLAPIIAKPIAKEMREVFREDAKGPHRSAKLLKQSADIEKFGLGIKLGD